MIPDSELLEKVKQIRYTPSFECRYIPPTNYRGSRVKLTFSHWADHSKKYTVTKSYDYQYNNYSEIGIHHLLKAGFNVSGYTLTEKAYQIFVNWENFKDLKTLLDNLKKS